MNDSTPQWIKNLRTKQRIRVTNLFFTAWNPKEIMLVVCAPVEVQSGDLFSFPSLKWLDGSYQFAQAIRGTKYNKLLEDKGFGKESDFNSDLNLRFSVLNLKLLDNFEVVQTANENHKTKISSRKRPNKSSK
jgi:hypothetical protein